MSRFNRLRLMCFVLVIGATLYYPIEQVVAMNRDAKTFIFTTRKNNVPMLVDNRWLYFDLEADRFPTTDLTPECISIAYAILDRDNNGIARIADVVVKKADIPDESRYIKAYYVRKVKDDNGKVNERHYRLRLPFSRYELNDKQAAAAAKILSERDKPHKASLAVKVYSHGYYSVEGISIDGTTLK